jgi:hypothetical protein
MADGASCAVLQSVARHSSGLAAGGEGGKGETVVPQCCNSTRPGYGMGARVEGRWGEGAAGIRERTTRKNDGKRNGWPKGQSKTGPFFDTCARKGARGNATTFFAPEIGISNRKSQISDFVGDGVGVEDDRHVVGGDGGVVAVTEASRMNWRSMTHGCWWKAGDDAVRPSQSGVTVTRGVEDGDESLARRAKEASLLPHSVPDCLRHAEKDAPP